MAENENQRLMAEATEFAKANVVAGAEELLQWAATGLLRNGVVRQLAHKIAPLAGSSSYQLAESLFNRAALERVAKQ